MVTMVSLNDLFMISTCLLYTSICDICRKAGALVIEDCAASLGTVYNGKLTGLFGNYAFFSLDVYKRQGRANNLGFGRANNLGYEYSHGKYVFLLNSDTYLLNNAVKIFYDRMSVLPQTVACLGCMLSGPDGRYSHSYGDYLRWRNAWQSVLVSAFGRDDSVIRSTD